MSARCLLRIIAAEESRDEEALPRTVTVYQRKMKARSPFYHTDDATPESTRQMWIGIAAELRHEGEKILQGMIEWAEENAALGDDGWDGSRFNKTMKRKRTGVRGR